MTMVEGEEVVGMTAGERLRAAREAAKMSLEDVATSTRIPTRHLESLENGDFSRLPAPTYSIGFAKSYAGAVGLDRNEIADQLRAEIGGTRLNPYQAEQYEAVDPARTMPRWLIAAAVAAIVLVAVLASWLNRRAQDGPDAVTANAAVPAEAQPAAAPAPVAAQPVVITATQPAWIQVKDGATMLKEGVLAAGESFAVPATATAPTLTTAKSEALKITVGTATAPPVGPPATRVSNVSLLPNALLHPAAAPVTTPAETKPAAAAPKHEAARPAAKKHASPPSAPPATAPANTADTSTPPTNP